MISLRIFLLSQSSKVGNDLKGGHKSPVTSQKL